MAKYVRSGDSWFQRLRCGDGEAFLKVEHPPADVQQENKAMSEKPKPTLDERVDSMEATVLMIQAAARKQAEMLEAQQATIRAIDNTVQRLAKADRNLGPCSLNQLACLLARVPRTGNEYLDAVINESRRLDGKAT